MAVWAALMLGATLCAEPVPPVPLGLRSDVVATDHLGRTLPGLAECGPLKPDKQVGIFYFLWLGEHAGDGPWDVTKILAADPQAMSKPDSPLWGPLYAAHHWGEPLFGYYRTDDPWVLRKHAQLLTDAGVDFVVFDVTNQVTYRQWYTALLDTWAEVRAEGGQTPSVAFLCPFWSPTKVVDELWRELYEPGIHPDLWYRLDGKPLILADPQLISPGLGLSEHDHPAALEPGHTLGQSFRLSQDTAAVGGSFPTWETIGSTAKLTLRREGPHGPIVAQEQTPGLSDNGWWVLRPAQVLPPGDYYLEMSDPTGQVGWWSHSQDRLANGTAYADGQPAAGDRTLRVEIAGDGGDPRLSFFTWRKPQPSYFEGPTGPDQWSWLEVYPQHVYTNSRGEREMISVGVAQNAVDNRLGSMSESQAKGRAWHDGAIDPAPDAVDQGLNFAEQWQHALAEDPRIIFVTGWNEWIAGRFAEFGGVKEPVMFVDQFDRAHSRDIEPMVGGHGDAYYYQLVSNVRRFKGVIEKKPPTPAPAVKTATLRSPGPPWEAVARSYGDDLGDTTHRDHLGYGRLPAYVNSTGRNDLTLAKVAVDGEALAFMVETAAPLSPATDPGWMWLLLDTDGRPSTGWQGYDYVVNRRPGGVSQTSLERHIGPGFVWQEVARVHSSIEGRRLVVVIPRSQIGLATGHGSVAFKWVDNQPLDGEVNGFLTAGDALPNARFNYVVTW